MAVDDGLDVSEPQRKVKGQPPSCVPGRRGNAVALHHGGLAACLAVSICLSACAVSVHSVPVSFVAAPGAEVSLERRVDVQLPTRYSRELAQGSRWRKVGSVPQGDVYRAVGTVFTIEGRNVHEAYLVVSPQRALVGFYLPGESTLSALAAPLPLPLKESP